MLPIVLGRATGLSYCFWQQLSIRTKLRF